MTVELLIIELSGRVGGKPLHAALREHGFPTRTATRADEVPPLLGSGACDVLIADLPDRAVDPALFRDLHVVSGGVPIVAVGDGDVSLVLGALRSGVVDYVLRPGADDIDALVAAIGRAARQRRLAAEVAALCAREDSGGELLIGDSHAIRSVKELLLQVADGDATVLITGESGTGKERAARLLHHLGPRRDLPFVALNAAAMPADLIESELFGHAHGAFTGAARARSGLFAAAEGGTVLLDEVGEMPLEAQTKLLRALQERRFRPVGSDTEVPFRARLVAATSRDLESAVVAGRFRPELFYRLNVIPVAMPPLRERRDDILPLAQHVLRRVAQRARKAVTGIRAAAAERLLEHDWPGNVRELENCIERAVLLTRFTAIGADDLPDRVGAPRGIGPGSPWSDLRTLSEMKHRYLRHVVASTGGNKSRSARILDIDRRTLCKHLRDTP